MTLRVAFLGNDRWSVPSLVALSGSPSMQVGLVVTNPPRPAGRGSRSTQTAVAEAARAMSLPLAEVPGLRDADGLGRLRAAAPDLLVVVAYGELLTGRVLDVAPLGAVNLHFSLLPRWRGASPVQRAILAGDETTGVSVMQIDEGLDTGPILSAQREPIHPDDDTGSLGARLATLGAPLLVETIRTLAAGTLTPRPQDASGATQARKLSTDERSIDWTEEPTPIVRRIRALAPEPGASTRVRGDILKVFRAEVARTGEAPEGPQEPERAGSVLAVGADGFTVAAGSGAVRPLEVAAAGRRRMSAAEWARGARLVPGERLG